jgi:hypothetical protein
MMRSTLFGLPAVCTSINATPISFVEQPSSIQTPRLGVAASGELKDYQGGYKDAGNSGD